MDEDFPFHPRGDFNRWLETQKNWPMSLGWAHAIEAQTAADDDQVGRFFDLLDEYASTGQPRDT